MIIAFDGSRYITGLYFFHYIIWSDELRENVTTLARLTDPFVT